jgi:hypothetical protein
MTLAESIEKYERITGEEFNHSPDLDLKTTPDGEFMLWKLFVHDDVPYFWIDQTFGQMIHFGDFIRGVCKSADITQIVTATTRNPKFHIRKWKMERLPEHDYCFEGRFYYVLKGSVNSLK